MTDKIVSRGVSTGIMHAQNDDHSKPLSSQELLSAVASSVESSSKWTHVVTAGDASTMGQRVREAWVFHGARMVIVDAGTNIPVASAAASELLRLEAEGLKAKHETDMGDEMLCVLAYGGSQWSSRFVEMQFDANPSGFPKPRQSWSVDFNGRAVANAEDFVPAGIFVASGRGLARQDPRLSLMQTSVRPSEGFLRVDQIAHELIAKIGAIPKFGA